MTLKTPFKRTERDGLKDIATWKGI